MIIIMMMMMMVRKSEAPDLKQFRLVVSTELIGKGLFYQSIILY